MELALIRSLMDKDFYENYKGTKCPDKLFSKDIRKIKQTLDYSMDKYERSLTADELKALFITTNSTMTTANKLVFDGLFGQLAKQKPMTNVIAEDVLSELFRQAVGEDIANIGFDYVNGSLKTLEPLRRIVEQYNDDFLPNLKVEWDDISMDTLLQLNDLEAKWKFNIPTLQRRVEGVNGGHLIVLGARPNTGKTSFHASMIAGPNGFVKQGAKCIVLVNEEAYHRVGARYLSAATGMSLIDVKNNPAKAGMLYKEVGDKLHLKDCTGKDLAWVEQLVKTCKPDILVLDMGDKFAIKNSDKSDVYLKEAAIYARNIAKQYGCAIFWMSQLSAEAEGRIAPNQSMLEGSKTGKAAEADLMILISKDPLVQGVEEESDIRHLIIAKNKLTGGWHGQVDCRLDIHTSHYLP
jgi:replicative DNA helicase